MAVNYRDNSTPSDIVSGAFGVEILTFVDSAAQGADQVCRVVIIWRNAGKTVKIGEPAVAATAIHALNDNKQYLKISIPNTNIL